MIAGALVVYAWLVFLPSFQGATEYASVRYVVIIVTVLLLIASGIQAILSVNVEKAESADSDERTKQQQAQRVYGSRRPAGSLPYIL